MAGFYGKLPVRGDFVHRNLEREIIASLESWFQEGIVKSEIVLQEKMFSKYFSAPVWHFYLSPGILDEQAWLGVWVASKDSAERKFPVVILAPCDKVFEVSDDINLYFDWFHDAQSLIFDVFDKVIDFDTFCDEVKQLEVYQDELADSDALPAPNSNLSQISSEQYQQLQGYIGELKNEIVKLKEEIAGLKGEIVSLHDANIRIEKRLEEQDKLLNKKLDLLIRHLMGEKINPIEARPKRRASLPAAKRNISHQLSRRLASAQSSASPELSADVDNHSSLLLTNNSKDIPADDSNEFHIQNRKATSSNSETDIENTKQLFAALKDDSSDDRTKHTSGNESNPHIPATDISDVIQEDKESDSEHQTQVIPRAKIPQPEPEEEHFTRVVRRQEASQQPQQKPTTENKLPIQLDTLIFNQNVVAHEQMQMEVGLDSSSHPVGIWVSAGSDSNNIKEQFVLTQRLPDADDFVKFIEGFD